MPLDPYAQKALLDWCTGGATPTRPTAWFIGFESGTPNFSADSAAPVFRSSISFRPASTGVSGSVSNAAVVTCTATANCTVFGWAVWNLTSGGTRLVWGTLSATHSLLSGSGAALAAGNLIITLA